MRNLNPDEIYDQVVSIDKQSRLFEDHPLTNIVFMGMGEPLLNYDNVMKAIDIITSDEGLGMSPRRITLSTVGLPKMIKRLADDDVKLSGVFLTINVKSGKAKHIEAFVHPKFNTEA